MGPTYFLTSVLRVRWPMVMTKGNRRCLSPAIIILLKVSFGKGVDNLRTIHVFIKCACAAVSHRTDELNCSFKYMPCNIARKLGQISLEDLKLSTPSH